MPKRRNPLEEKIEPAPRSFRGLCGHCIEETMVRLREMPDERIVPVCDACFRHGAIWLDFITPAPPVSTLWDAQGGRRQAFADLKEVDLQLP
jgi:NMD protein affecting ribosome stability and mRNA decay